MAFFSLQSEAGISMGFSAACASRKQCIKNRLSIFRILNLAMNKLEGLPRGFGSFPVLEVLDLSYNDLSDEGMPGNFWMMHCLRALYLSDNRFEYLSPDIKHMVNLRILAVRDNELIEVPQVSSSKKWG